MHPLLGILSGNIRFQILTGSPLARHPSIHIGEALLKVVHVWGKVDAGLDLLNFGLVLGALVGDHLGAYWALIAECQPACDAVLAEAV